MKRATIYLVIILFFFIGVACSNFNFLSYDEYVKEVYKNRPPLSNVSISHGSLVPPFSPDVYKYDFLVSDDTDLLTIIAESGRGIIKIDDVSSDVKIMNIADTTDFSFIITSSDGDQERIYRFTGSRHYNGQDGFYLGTGDDINGNSVIRISGHYASYFWTTLRDEDIDITGISYGNGKVVVLGYNEYFNNYMYQTNNYHYTSDEYHGYRWGLFNSIPSINTGLECITYGNGMFIAAGTDSALIYSYGGMIWQIPGTGVDIPANFDFADITFHNNSFYAWQYAPASFLKIDTVVDEIQNVEVLPITLTRNIRDVIVTDGNWYAISEFTADMSTDIYEIDISAGTLVETHEIEPGIDIKQAAFTTDNHFIAVGSTGLYRFDSAFEPTNTDPSDDIIADLTSDLTCIISGPDRLVTAGTNGVVYYTTDNAGTWTPQDNTQDTTDYLNLYYY